MYATLQAAVDAVVPADRTYPGGWDGGVAALLEHHGDVVLGWAGPALRRVTDALDAAARERHGSSFPSLGADTRTALLTAFAERAPEDFAALLRVTFEGYYGTPGGREPPSWAMVGFQPLGTAAAAVEPAPVPVIAPDAVRAHYDVVVVGAGAGGGVVAAVLAEAGAQVLLLERAPAHTDAALRGDHLRGKRAAVYQPTAGPGPGHPRVLEAAGRARVVDCATEPWAWGLNAMALGGGTRVWQGMAWRFMPEDFAMASTYGVPARSSLADWPVGYDALAPYYDKVEWEIGVAGESGGPLVARTPRARGYPMPALPADPSGRAFGAAAERLGWRCGPVPFAINSVPRGGRAACARCPQCVGHPSPVDAKNGTHNTVIPRAVATGRCDVLTSAQAIRIEHGDGRARAVHVVVETPQGPAARTIASGRVVVCAGAVETPRLLLVSGLGGPAVGTNLHNHSFALFYGRAAEPINPYVGPGHSVATLDFVHRDGEAWGGGVLFDAPALLPVVAARAAPLVGGPAWGAAHKAWMASELPYVAGVMGIGQEVPSAHARVSADPHVRDVHGMPVARLVAHEHAATAEVRAYMAERLVAWLHEAGVERPADFYAGAARPAAGEHSAGTCRMGEDPTTSACDPAGRLHGTDNVHVADASSLPTNGSVNPALTTMANAWRVAEALAAQG
ncbi:MAG TPA: GMC family oxidoreductase [Solirubrobacteraceae bacterium]|nr:GMC family oxidoreductase [Solirubrobacteraceae bacterium]